VIIFLISLFSSFQTSKCVSMLVAWALTVYAATFLPPASWIIEVISPVMRKSAAVSCARAAALSSRAYSLWS